MSKKRAMITVNAKQWDSLQEELKTRGYPSNSMSFYIGACLDHLEDYFDGKLDETYDPVFDLEIHRQGLKAALADRGMTISEKEKEE